MWCDPPPVLNLVRQCRLSPLHPMAATSVPVTHVTPPTIRIINEAEVEACIQMKQAVHINAQAFIAAYEGIAIVPPYSSIVEPSPLDSTFSHASLFKSAQVLDALGVKVVCVRPSNSSSGLPTVPAMILLTDRLTGMPTAMVEATYLTAMRTAAGSAAATEAAAKERARVLVIFGAGMQAREHIRAMITVRPTINQVHIVNRTAARANQLIDEIKNDYPSLHFHVHATSPSTSESAMVASASRAALALALKSADIICTTTNCNTPLVTLSDVSPGVHINAIGSYLPHMHELSSDLVGASRIAIDTDSASHAGDLQTPLESGVIRKEQLIPVGAYLSRDKYGHMLQSYTNEGFEPIRIGFDLPPMKTTQQQTHVAPWRRNESDITLFKSVGSAVQDIATAYAVLQVDHARHSRSIAVDTSVDSSQTNSVGSANLPMTPPVVRLLSTHTSNPPVASSRQTCDTQSLSCQWSRLPNDVVAFAIGPFLDDRSAGSLGRCSHRTIAQMRPYAIKCFTDGRHMLSHAGQLELLELSDSHPELLEACRKIQPIPYLGFGRPLKMNLSRPQDLKRLPTYTESVTLNLFQMCQHLVVPSHIHSFTLHLKGAGALHTLDLSYGLVHLDLEYPGMTLTIPESVRNLKIRGRIGGRSTTIPIVTWPKKLIELNLIRFQSNVELPPLPDTLLQLTTTSDSLKDRSIGFRQRADGSILPPAVTSLTIDDWALPWENLPFNEKLKELTFTGNVNSSLPYVPPTNQLCQLHTLRFGLSYHGSFVQVWYPPHLTDLHLPYTWDRPVSQLTLPSTLRHLTFGHDFNQPLSSPLDGICLHFPPQLESLKFGDRFSQPLHRVVWPETLRILELGRGFIQHPTNLPMIQSIPNTLKEIRVFMDRRPTARTIEEAWREIVRTKEECRIVDLNQQNEEIYNTSEVTDANNELSDG